MQTAPTGLAREVQGDGPSSYTQNAGARTTRRLTSLVQAFGGHALPWAILFGVALAFRQRQLDQPLYGDQALYFYLSKTLGFAPPALRDLETLWTHVAVRPFMYVFFWPWANLGMTAFQVANILVGALIPCLIYCLSLRFRVQPAIAAIVALAASVHPVLVTFSAKGFPDNLATALVLAGYLAYFANRTALAFTLLLLTVLTKEAFAMFLLPLVADGAHQYLRTRSKIILAPLAGLMAVAITSALSIYVLNGRLQGWGSGKPEAWFFKAFLVSSWFTPLYALLLLQGHFRALLIGLAAPVFFAVWGFVLHRGIEQWYVYGPFCVALVAFSVSLQEAMRRVATATNVPGSSSTTWERLKSTLTTGCAAALLATIVVLPEQAGWRSWLDLVKLEQLFVAKPKAPIDHSQNMARFIEKRRPNQLLIMNTFWAYAYYPFGTTAKHVTTYFAGEENDAVARSELAALVRRHEYVLVGDSPSDSKQATGFRQAFRPCELQTSGKLTLYAVNANCLAELSH